MLTENKPEGQILREFVDSQNVNVTKLSKALGIKRQSFYQYYDSTVLNTDTKQKIEAHLGKQIFAGGSSYIEKRRLHKMEQKQGIPIFEDAPFTLTNTESFRDIKLNEPDFWITIPGLRNCNYGCRAVGDSMHPLIRSHALVVGEELSDFSFVPSGDVYIIRGKNGVETVKYIHPHDSDPDKFLLVPYNEKAKTDSIRKEDILKLYKAKAVFNVL